MSPEQEIRLLAAEWVRKADLDLKTATRLLDDAELGSIVGFHAQQAVEKYLKALLTRYQIEFPKTHVIRRLLILLAPVLPELPESVGDVNWLSPFGAEMRYPGDSAEVLPGEAARACDLAKNVRGVVAGILDSWLLADCGPGS